MKLTELLVRKIRAKLIPTFPNNSANPSSFFDLMFQIRDVLFHGDFASLQFTDHTSDSAPCATLKRRWPIPEIHTILVSRCLLVL